MKSKIKIKSKKNKAHAHIYSLGADRVEAIDLMIFKNITVTDIARRIQGEWKSFTDTKFTTLKQQVGRYKISVIAKAKAKTLIDARNTKGGLARKTLEYQIQDYVGIYNAETKLKALCMLQEQRMMKLHEKESNLPVLMESMRREVETYKGLLSQLVNVQMDLGILQRVPKQVVGDLRVLSAFGEEQKTILAGQDANYDARLSGHHKVFTLLEQIAEGDVIE